jgi:hypothetical protein
VLVFTTEMLARTIDPLFLLAAFSVGGLAASRGTIESRWMVIVVGAAMIVLSIAILGVVSSSHSGKLFRFDWAGAAAASLQVYFISWAVSMCRAGWRRQQKSMTLTGRAGTPVSKSTHQQDALVQQVASADWPKATA